MRGDCRGEDGSAVRGWANPVRCLPVDITEMEMDVRLGDLAP